MSSSPSATSRLPLHDAADPSPTPGPEPLGAPSLTAAEKERLIAAAVRAPSSHNTQPWRFRCVGDRIELYADRTRSLPVNDPADRELTISCGAALATLRIAAAAAGVSTRLERFPAGVAGDLLAVVRLARGGAPDHVAVAGAIPWRVTHRGPFSPGPLPPRLADELGSVAAAHSAVIAWVPPGPAREAVARLVGRGDRAQFANPRWRAELAAWLRPRRSGDGLTVPELTGPLTRLAVTHLDLGRRTGLDDQTLVRDAPGLAVLATRGDGREAWLATGEALGEMLLHAAARGVMAGYANQPCQLPGLRLRLQEELALAGCPQLVLRFGVPVRLGPLSPRRTVHEVMLPA